MHRQQNRRGIGVNGSRIHQSIICLQGINFRFVLRRYFFVRSTILPRLIAYTSMILGSGPELSYKIQLFTNSRYISWKLRNSASKRLRTVSSGTSCPPGACSNISADYQPDEKTLFEPMPRKPFGIDPRSLIGTDFALTSGQRAFTCCLCAHSISLAALAVGISISGFRYNRPSNGAIALQIEGACLIEEQMKN